MGFYIACAIYFINSQRSGGTPSLNLSAQMLLEQTYGKKIRLINYTEGLVGVEYCADVFLLSPEILPWVGYFYFIVFFMGLRCFDRRGRSLSG